MRKINIVIKKRIEVEPEDLFESEIVKSGNGAVAKAKKQHIGKKCLIIIKGADKHGKI